MENREPAVLPQEGTISLAMPLNPQIPVIMRYSGSNVFKQVLTTEKHKLYIAALLETEVF